MREILKIIGILCLLLAGASMAIVGYGIFHAAFIDEQLWMVVGHFLLYLGVPLLFVVVLLFTVGMALVLASRPRARTPAPVVVDDWKRKEPMPPRKQPE